MPTPTGNITMRVSSSARTPNGSTWGETPFGNPSFLDVHVFDPDNLPLGTDWSETPPPADIVYDAYCLDPIAKIKIISDYWYSADTYDGNTAESFVPVGLPVDPDQDQVDAINWLLGQNFTSDTKYGGNYNFGEVQTAIWTILGFDAAEQAGYERYLSDNNRQVVDLTDANFLVAAATNAVAQEKAGLPTSAFSQVLDPVAQVASSPPYAETELEVQAQGLIIQLYDGKLGDYVWYDCNGNGIQNDGETGVDGVVVNLLDGDGNVIATTKTGDDYSTAAVEKGYYQFVGLKPADYSIEVVKPTGYSFTVRDQGSDDAKDSDVDPQTGQTIATSLTAGESDQTWDAGLISGDVCLKLDLTVNTNSGCDAGNIRTVSQNGLSAKISAFSRNDSNGAWNAAYLASYSSGLGVTDTWEDGSSPSHAVDNVGGRDNYILFEFNRAVILDKAFLGWVSGDSDLQVWIGTTNDPYGNHLTLNDALLSGMFTEVDNTTLTSTRWADVNGNALAGNVVVIAASTADTTPNDYFKVKNLDLCTPQCGLTASIGDRIWYDNDADGIQDSGESGVAGVRIDLMDGANNKVGTTTTDSSGKYLFKDLAPGQYQVNIDESTLPTGYSFTASNQGNDDAKDSDIIDTAAYPKSYGRMEVTTLSAGENDLTWDAGIVRKACVGNRVWEDQNHNNIQDNTEPGIGGIKVKLYNAGANGEVGGGDDTFVGSATTDSSGYYKFTVDPGRYYLQFDKANVYYKNVNMSTWFWASQDVGKNDAVDSDVIKTTNQVTTTKAFTLNSGANDMTRDAGITPIVIDLDGGGILTVSRSESNGTFDFFGNGSPISSGWIGAGEGFLAVDKSGNGRIDSISELFGGTAKGAGFAQLADYDSNGDGLVNAGDNGFAELRIWRDANGNHQTDDGELMSLAEAGVSEMNAGYTDMPFLDRQGNLHLERSSATMTDGRSVDMTDVYFAVSSEDAAAAGVALPDIASLLEEIAAAPVRDAGWLFA
jgi:serine-aspartate repeat-containing protein C/D/E